MIDTPRPLSPAAQLEDPDFLREWFEYDTDSPSCLKWKKRRPFSHARAGDHITYKTNYYTVEICKRRVRCHRIILLLHGMRPKPGEVADHINRNRFDNRIENLRWVLPYQNNANKAIKAPSGLRYVYITPQGRFRSHYRKPMANRSIDCGTYDTALDAHLAAISHKLEHCWNP